MNTFQKKLALLIVIVLSAALTVNACTSSPFVGAQPEPTPLPTVIEAGVVTADGWVTPVRYTALGFMTGGKLSEIRVSEEQEVRQGDVVAIMGQRETLEAALTQAKLELLSAQQTLDKLYASADLARQSSAVARVEAEKALLDAQKLLDHLNTNQFRDRLDELNDDVEDAKDEQEDARDERDKHLGLDRENWTRKNVQEKLDKAELAYKDAVYDRNAWQNQLDQAQAAVNLAQAQLDEAQRVFETYRDGPDPEDIALAQARLDNANAQVAGVEISLENLTLTAPYDATVVQVSDKAPGEMAAPGEMIIVLADYSKWMVETRDLTELDVVKVKVGQKVVVTLDALPALQLAGVVEAIDQGFTERSGDILYAVRIRLDEVDPLLRWGMTVTITFE